MGLWKITMLHKCCFWVKHILKNYIWIYVFLKLLCYDPIIYYYIWRSPDLVSVVFVTTESDLGQCPFALDDAFFSAIHEGKRFLDCVWVRLLPMGPRDHMQEMSYLTCSLCCPWGERKTLRVWVRLLSMGTRVYITERKISCQLWMDRSLTGLCGSVVYLW